MTKPKSNYRLIEDDPAYHDVMSRGVPRRVRVVLVMLFILITFFISFMVYYTSMYVINRIIHG